MSTVGFRKSPNGRIRDGEGSASRKPIASIEVAPEARTVRIRFEDGDSIVADMGEYIGEGGVFEQLDDPDLFAEADVTTEGLVLEWPGDPPLDFDASALWKRFGPPSD